MTTAALTTNHPVPQIEALALPGCDAPLPVLRDESGQGWLQLKAACENMGLGWEGQRQRLLRQAWAVTCEMQATAPADGKTYSMMFLRADRVAMWLATLNAKQVKNKEAARRIAIWQQHAADVLDRWVRGVEEPLRMVVTSSDRGEPVRVSASETILPELLAELRESREDRKEARQERVASLQALTAIIGMVGEMTKKPATALPAVAEHVVPPVVEKEWVTAEEACTVVGRSYNWLYQEARPGGVLARVRRRQSPVPGRRGGAIKLWHLQDLRLALTGRKSAAIPAQTWTADVPPPPAQPTLPNVVPIRPEVKVEQPKQEPAKFMPTALRDAVLYTVRTTVRDMHLTPEHKHRLWLALYAVFTKRFQYDPRKMHAKKQKAIEYIEQRGDMAGLLQVAQEVCEALKKKGPEYLQEQSA